MKPMNYKSATLLYWGLVLILTGLIGLVFQVRDARAAEFVPVASSRSESGALDGRTIPSAATTRQYDDKVLFRYLDEGFDAVQVAGSFNGWEPVDLELDPKSGAWSVTVGVKPGRFSYQFLVQENGEIFEALDPSNLNARRDTERGWVSVITVPDSSEQENARQEDDEESEPRRGVIDFELRLGHDDEPAGDDEALWRNHRQRYVRRELELAADARHDEDLALSFQRVDGLSIALSPAGISREDFGPSVRGLFSYGFRSTEWTLGAKLVQPLIANRRLLAVVAGHSGTDYRDNTGIGSLENSLAAVFFREDYRDYYKREGLSASLVAYPLSSIRLEAGYAANDFSSLQTRETWSFADGQYAANPAVDEGTLRAWFARAIVGSRFNHVAADWETARNREGDDFDYSLLKTTYRGRLNMSCARYLDFRVMYATGLSGEVPMQRRFPVGGLGTVRGYYYQSLLRPDPGLTIHSPARGGQRMAVANFEYAFTFDTDVFWNVYDRDNDWEGFDDFGDLEIDSALFLFFDTGMAWEDRTAALDLDDLKSSVGVGFQFDDGGPRFDIVKTLDDGGHDTLFQIRLERAF